MGITKARQSAGVLPGKPPVTLHVGGEPVRFRAPRPSEMVDAQDAMNHILKHFPGLPVAQALAAACLANCYLPQEGESGDYPLEFARLAADNEFAFATLDAEFSDAFPEWGDWMAERIAAKNGSGQPVPTTDATATTSGAG